MYTAKIQLELVHFVFQIGSKEEFDGSEVGRSPQQRAPTIVSSLAPAPTIVSSLAPTPTIVSSLAPAPHQKRKHALHCPDHFLWWVKSNQPHYSVGDMPEWRLLGMVICLSVRHHSWRLNLLKTSSSLMSEFFFSSANILTWVCLLYIDCILVRHKARGADGSIWWRT